MEEIRRLRLDAPVRIGQVAIPNVLGLGSDVIVTKNIGRGESRT
jgi:CxxC motif-containing protein